MIGFNVKYQSDVFILLLHFAQLTDAGWSTWSEGECSATCGQGTRQKTRTCQNGNIGDEGCEIGSETTTEVDLLFSIISKKFSTIIKNYYF